MIGRAGRPGFDTSAEAVVMVVKDKKNFYKKVKFLIFVHGASVGFLHS